MIGTYIITRMIELATNKEANVVAKLAAIITALVTIFCIFGLIYAGQRTGASLRMP